jgi:hypothetical protein
MGHPDKKIYKEIIELNDAINQMDLTDVYRIFHPISTQETFFSPAHGSFSKIDHILGHKASFSKCKKIEITSCILPDHNKNNSRKYSNNWKLNNTLFNHQWVIEELREEIKRFLKANKMKISPTRTYGTQQRQS